MGAFYGALTSLIEMAFAFLGNSILAFPFFPINLFDWLTRHLPGVVIHTAIQLIVSTITALAYLYGCQVSRTNSSTDSGFGHGDRICLPWPVFQGTTGLRIMSNAPESVPFARRVMQFT
jgi:hypothetical protein